MFSYYLLCNKNHYICYTKAWVNCNNLYKNNNVQNGILTFKNRWYICSSSKILLIFLKQSLHNWILIKNRPACSLYIKYVLTWHEASLAYNLKNWKSIHFLKFLNLTSSITQKMFWTFCIFLHPQWTTDLLHSSCTYIHIYYVCAIATRIMTNKQTDLTPLTSIFSRVVFEKKTWPNLKIL